MRALVVLPPSKTSLELDLFRAMPEWDVEVVTGDGFGPVDADHHLRAVRIPYLGRPERWTAALAWHRGLSNAASARVDVVVSFELHAPVSGQANRLARRLHVPHVVGVWETLPGNPLYKIPPWRSFLRGLRRSADLFVCFTERARRHCVSLGCAPERCAVVYPGVDLDQYRPRVGGLPDDPIMLFVGELRADKGIVDVITACDQVEQRGAGLRLVVVGGGPLEARVTELAATRPYVDYVGRVARDRVADLMREARALVVAPFHRRFWEEQFGFAYVEAMASGLPVVTTRCGAIPEVVPSDNFIVPERDVGALADAIERVRGPVANPIGQGNRATAENRYDLERQGHRLALLLREVVADRRPSVGA